MRCFAGGDVHNFPVEDDTGVHCPEHGVTLLWRDVSASAAELPEADRPEGRPTDERT